MSKNGHKKHELSFIKTLFYPFSLIGTLSYELLSRFSPNPGRKLAHYNIILEGKKNHGNLILGAQPIATKQGKHGDHGNQLITLCKNLNKPLGAVFSLLTYFELNGGNLKGIRVVLPKFWKEKKVKHHFIPMEDLSNDVDIKVIKKEVDAAHDFISRNYSVYVHCKAGCGRSFTFVMCYLLANTNLNANEALTLILRNRPQIYPSPCQYDLIEQFRKVYAKKKAPLDLDKLNFSPLQSNVLTIAKNPLFHTLIGSLISTVLRGLSFSPIGLIIGAFSWATQNVYNRIRMNSYRALPHHKTKKELTSNLSTFTLKKLQALQSGIESGRSWKGWGSNLINPTAFTHYQLYLAGRQAAQNHDQICDVVPIVINKKLKKTKATTK